LLILKNKITNLILSKKNSIQCLWFNFNMFQLHHYPLVLKTLAFHLGILLSFTFDYFIVNENNEDSKMIC